MIPRQPTSTLFPYTTLFRSIVTYDPAFAGRSHIDEAFRAQGLVDVAADRKSTRLNSSHGSISYAVFCLKKKTLKSLGVDVHKISRARQAEQGRQRVCDRVLE